MLSNRLRRRGRALLLQAAQPQIMALIERSGFTGCRACSCSQPTGPAPAWAVA